MRFRWRPSWVLVGLALTVAACGAAEPDRFSLVTPGAHTGQPGAEAALPTMTPSPTATPKATATPQASRKPVTPAEKRVIKGWSDELRQGHVTAASRYFSVPTRVSNTQPGWVLLNDRDAIKEFNRTLPCGAKLIRTRRSVNGFVVGVFRLTERPGGECGTGTGEMAAVAFLIRRNHINSWVRVDDAASPSATATPAPAPIDEVGIPGST